MKRRSLLLIAALTAFTALHPLASLADETVLKVGDQQFRHAAFSKHPVS